MVVNIGLRAESVSKALSICIEQLLLSYFVYSDWISALGINSYVLSLVLIVFYLGALQTPEFYSHLGKFLRGIS